ncbi:hypothetical protein BG011_005580 [Mortierella polycephala]|uniref:F-box domain-containing protein n=1 Tax=Mortierella polycephala TaxID=41804 RepID=A0A9P6QC13_9FUNG|nr:hypothetical protein BG011_005580 [Mortierella polycephala]
MSTDSSTYSYPKEPICNTIDRRWRSDLSLSSPSHHQTRSSRCSSRSIESDEDAVERERHLHSDASAEKSTRIQSETPPATFEMLMKKITDQRTKLEALHSGAQILEEDAMILDETLEEGHVSMGVAWQESQRVVLGWEHTVAKCEPLDVLQKRPSMLSTLIQGMSWQDKKDLFEQLVANCCPRETYQLQHQITVRHGSVLGFDLLEESPLDISMLIMKHLSFADLSSCRMVSRAWQRKATAFEVVLSAIKRLSYNEDLAMMEPVGQSRKNWNQLCRVQERESRWKKGNPVSVHPILGHTSYVTSVKDCGEWIVSGGYDEKVRLWEAATGKCVKIWEVDSAVSYVEALVDPKLSGGGVVVAAFIDVGLVKVWSLQGPLKMQTLSGHQKGVRAMAINDKYLVTAGFDQTVLVWSWLDGRRVASFRAHNEAILGVHLFNNTVFTFCIDATLRVFDIPSRALLHQVKLFDVQHGSSLQWSYLQDKTFLTSTNKTVYVWQLEHLETLVRQQQHLPCGVLATAPALSSDSSESKRNCTPPLTPPRATLCSAPTLSLTSSGSNSSNFYLCKTASSSSSFQGTHSDSTVLETRIKPCLTAILSMNTDMWCGKVTHHRDTPLLVIGSRSSPVKLAVLALTTDIIDPNKVYDINHEPRRLSPKSIPVQGMPEGHGRGVMCIDSSAGRIVVGSTGGPIQIMNMDPAKRTLMPLKSNNTPPMITLPHLTPTQMDSIRSVSPVHHPLQSISAKTSMASMPKLPLVNAGYLKTAPAIFKSNSTPTLATYQDMYGLPLPDRSPLLPPIPILLETSFTGTQGSDAERSSSRLNRKSKSHSTVYDEQEVLVDSDEDLVQDNEQDKVHSSAPTNTVDSIEKSSARTKHTVVNIASQQRMALSASSSTLQKSAKAPTSDATRGVSSSKQSSTRVPSTSSAAKTLSNLSKYIPSSPTKIMARRRASSTNLAQQATSTTSAEITASVGTGSRGTLLSASIRNRNRSESDLVNSAARSTPTTKSVSKGWSLSSPWNSPSRRLIKIK